MYMNAYYYMLAYSGIDIDVVFHEALYHLYQATLTCQMQRRGKPHPRGPRPSGTVHVSSIPYQETSSGCVVEENGSVQ